MRAESLDPPPDRLRAGRRAPGLVRRGLIEAGISLARAGGPEAVVLREATRRVGVAPNAAYRHFADRDALLAAVCLEALQELARRMEAGMAAVAAPPGSAEEAWARLAAIGRAYVEFATSEPGFFATAFASPAHAELAATGDPQGKTPLQVLTAGLDALVATGALSPKRRAGADFVAWSAVHGLAMLINQGPLQGLPPTSRNSLTEHLLATIRHGL